MKNEIEIIRKPAVAGYFYPRDKEDLMSTINSYMQRAQISEKYSNVFGVVSPHAGYTYSGYSAAFAFNVLRNAEFDTAIILSPSHREYFTGISLYSGDAYSTPFGVIEVNKIMRENLLETSENIFAGEEGHRTEHAIEVQLPFLQAVKKNIQIVPVVIGDQRRKYVEELAAQLAKVMDEKTVVIASSDLSHFHSKERADKLDSIVAENINSFDAEQLQSNLEYNNCEACGGGGIVALMKAAEMKNYSKAKVLSRTDSGDVSGDYSSVVGYLSAVIYN